MKKHFINDALGFYVMLFCFGFFVGFLILSLSSNAPNRIALCITSWILWGGFALVCLLCLLLRTEWIFMNEHRIGCLRAGKKIIIEYADISAIEHTKKAAVGVEGTDYPGWQITDTHGYEIRIVSTKRRQCVLDYLREQKEKQLHIST